ncbi:hypothetical protein BDV36DRAFT_301905 [Aspergillus pseudocaelatus]|uniref:FAD-binding domain-containing protein n=1 Tax=Aspergillus pseudocaelatus TaxID=1825620 RepID=A0ABQ6W2I5_9EURO|nr:hypothetical protein BDV36DRAFT_301905 [Aspergillus pseudocaelatus]
MGAFKVVIIGGSVAGLTLANIMQRYGIEYIVLEKFPKIAPQLGASSIGVNDRIEALGKSAESMKAFGPDSMRLSSLGTFGQVFKQLLNWLQIQLPRSARIDTSTLQYNSGQYKIVVSKGILTIKELNNSRTVTTQDGTKYTKVILVRAVRVHSGTRDELWRIADSDGLPTELNICVHNEKDSVAEIGDDIPLPGLIFGDVYERRQSADLTPLREYVLDKCFYKRAHFYRGCHPQGFALYCVKPGDIGASSYTIQGIRETLALAFVRVGRQSTNSRGPL